MPFQMQDYVEVSDRIRAWYAEHPEGAITTEIVELTDARVVVRAAARREIGGPPAGVGHSFLAIPGATPYTKGSELENAETSAVGRALVMAGIPSKNVASASEVKSKKGSPVRSGRPQPSEASGEKTAVSGMRAADTEWGAKPSPAVEEVDTDLANVGAGNGAAPNSLEEMPAGSEQWERLIHVAGGTVTKAVNRLNATNKTAYTAASAQGAATVAEVALAISGGS